MSATEVACRVEDHAKKIAWLPEQVDEGGVVRPKLRWVRRLEPTHKRRRRRFDATICENALSHLPVTARNAIITSADEILAGHWTLLGVTRWDMVDPDWFFDPLTGRTAPRSKYCFRIDHRSEEVTGNVKQVWELSRLQHVTVLAAAFAISQENRYAERAAGHLRSWWDNNPFLSGVHWTSGIEVGLRLITWAWVRRLLDGWTGAAELFEDNTTALRQIWWHQRYLHRFHSRGSSANNHVIAEAAGQLIGSLAFNWFEESDRWAEAARALLEDELIKNTFPTGVNREMAFEYHGFVAELGLVAAIEADKAGRPLSDETWQVLCRMTDIIAAVVDTKVQPPRYGDGDDGRALLITPEGSNRWESLLALGREVFGALDWWPLCETDANSTLLASLADKHPGLDRPSRRPSHFADAGLTILRTPAGAGPELWCRCDGGPHGFLSIAAHAHADALSVEIRHDGTEVLADPGTYCYHSEPTWRHYFRSTLGHNTVELAHQDQSASGGPTLWTRHARSRLVEVDFDEDGEARAWSGDHDGYESLNPPALHRRTVRLLNGERRIEIVDVIETSGRHAMRVAFHFGPDIPRREGERLVGAAELGEPKRGRPGGDDVVAAHTHLVAGGGRQRPRPWLVCTAVRRKASLGERHRRGHVHRARRTAHGSAFQRLTLQ